MRHFHVLRNREHCPIVNLDKIWSMMPEGTLEKAKAAGGKAPVIDVTESVSIFLALGLMRRGHGPAAHVGWGKKCIRSCTLVFHTGVCCGQGLCLHPRRHFGRGAI